MKKILIAAIVCGGMGLAGSWYVADAIKKRWPEPDQWKEVDNKKSKVYEVKGKWKENVLELIR